MNVRTLPLVLLGLALCCARTGASSDVRFDAVARASNGVALRWQSSTGAAFTMQFQDRLDDGVWRFAPQDPFPTTSNVWVDPQPTQAMRFYRVVEVAAPQRGKLLSATLSRTMGTFEIGFLFAVAGVPISPQYSVRMYKVVYETCTPFGGRTTASGALLLPENTGKPLPVVSYQHGTITRTNDAPSSMNISNEVSIGVAFATTGYAALVPDYLGLGVSPGLHPYHHARSEATACVDFLRAARTFCATNGFPLTNKLFLTGYSQGGHATMALFRELETFHTNEFTVTACAPMAGAYDLSGVTTTDFLSGRLEPNPYYFLFLLAAYQEVYHLAPSLGDLLVPQYNTTLPPLMNGNSTGGQINSAMPTDPVQVLKPEYLAAFRNNPRHPLRLALQENDVYRWKPHAPMLLYHCSGDQDVVVANSQVAAAAFQAMGVPVTWTNTVPGATHGECAQPSLMAAKTWFDSLK